ncbi:MAG: TlpA disulfide reductase family protein [Candidatus Nanopelagicales bacterium]|nr:TlpA disulfide reductase family protein [Candidatus Nanopelagicales bacterium]
MLLAACGRDAQGSLGSPAGDQNYVSADGSVQLKDPNARQLAPVITGTTLEGGTWSIEDHRGHIIVFNVWASWCAPCRAEAPILKRISEKYEASGVDFVGLNIRDSTVSAIAFEKKFGITYPSLVDTGGELVLRFAGNLNPSAIPSTLLVDKQGRVAASILGKVTEAMLTGLIKGLQREPDPTRNPSASSAAPDDD